MNIVRSIEKLSSCVPAPFGTNVLCWTRFYSNAVSARMEQARKKVDQMNKDPGNDIKLKMYALFKQATLGPCNTGKPAAHDFFGQAKWSAWSNLGLLSKEDAETQYIELIENLVGPIDMSAASIGQQIHEEASMVIPGLDIIIENSVCTLTLNKPKTLNAITLEMYDGIRDTLNNTAVDESVKLVCITGSGSYFSSGNDLSNFSRIPPEGLKKLAFDGRERLYSFVKAFIDYPKPIVCGVNGPAVGIMVTILALTDLVYAADSATFQTPFMALGQGPEGCSSYTFPKIMGYARANDMLLAGRKLTAQEAFNRGLVTDVFLQQEFHQTLHEKLKYMSALPPKSVLYGKALNRDRERELLTRVNEEECLRLEERWLSPECMQAIMKFLSKSSK